MLELRHIFSDPFLLQIPSSHMISLFLLLLYDCKIEKKSLSNSYQILQLLRNMASSGASRAVG